MVMYSQVFRQLFLITHNNVRHRSVSISNNSQFVLLQCSKLVSSDSNNGVSEMRRHFHSTPLVRDVFTVQDEDDFKSKVMESKKPVIVEFHAEWCGPCKQLMPRLESIVHGLKGEPVDLAKIDIDELPDIALEFGVGAVPSVLAIRDGKVVDKFIGLQDEDKIKTFISKISKK